MNKQKLYFIFGIVLFAVAGLLLAYVAWSFSYCADIISAAKASGQLSAAGNEYDIVSFYMGNCAQYFVYVLLLAAVGMIVQKKNEAVIDGEGMAPLSAKAAGESDDELDRWFEEIDNN